MRKLLIRIGIVGFWLALLAFILYWPRIDWRHLESNSINVFAWGDILDPEVIEDFERKTGIKVHLNYYSSNEELLVKLKATKGEGYDLIVPSDYAVQILIREGLLKPLDKTKLDFWEHLNPLLLGKFYDPANEYSVPFEWEMFGLGVDQSYFQTHPFSPSWRLIFDRNLIDYKIGMRNDPIEAILFASFYLYGYKENLANDEINSIRNLLVQQHNWVAVYADFRADYLLATRNCPVVVASSSYIWRTMREFPYVNFIVPKEGTFITIENLALPIATSKEELVYRLMNFLYTKESSATHFNTFGFFPSTTHAFDLMNLDPLAEKLMRSSKEEFEKYHFVQVLLPEDVIRDIWVDVKLLP
jgi:spermidine/putrescine transport system substrate-binding protein